VKSPSEARDRLLDVANHREERRKNMRGDIGDAAMKERLEDNALLCAAAVEYTASLMAADLKTAEFGDQVTARNVVNHILSLDFVVEPTKTSRRTQQKGNGK
jgi:hypothetical protein